ncbi:MAG: UDP-glucose 4-epimerase GalE [Chloroflexota bacterium]
MKVLVIGGAGYVGSVAAEALLSAGHQVVIYDNLSRGHAAAAPPGAELIVADLADTARLARVLARGRFDAVMHFAALSLVAESVREPARYFHQNVGLTLQLLQLMLGAGVRRFVFSSSAAVYGEPRTVPIAEDHPTVPTSPYGQTKLMVEEALGWLGRLAGLRFASLRYFNAAGATDRLGEDHRPETHLIPSLLEVAAGKRPFVEVYGRDYPTPDGTCIRDFVHVADIADAHLKALERLDWEEQIICNLGSGSGYSVLEVTEAARRVTGRPVAVKFGPRRPGDPAVLVASRSRAEQAIGWRPKYDNLELIIGSAWEWRCRHPDGYGRTD